MYMIYMKIQKTFSLSSTVMKLFSALLIKGKCRLDSTQRPNQSIKLTFRDCSILSFIRKYVSKKTDIQTLMSTERYTKCVQFIHKVFNSYMVRYTLFCQISAAKRDLL